MKSGVFRLNTYRDTAWIGPPRVARNVANQEGFFWSTGDFIRAKHAERKHPRKVGPCRNTKREGGEGRKRPSNEFIVFSTFWYIGGDNRPCEEDPAVLRQVSVSTVAGKWNVLITPIIDARYANRTSNHLRLLRAIRRVHSMLERPRSGLWQ